MYDVFYGLSNNPFQLTPDASFYFESATHRRALSYLGFGLARAEGFVIITGDAGTGKSISLNHLMPSIDRTKITAAMCASDPSSGHDAVALAARAFRIDTTGLDQASSMRSIENYLHAEARAGRRCLLVIDDAQNLSVGAMEELRLLADHQLGSISLLQVFLVGRPAILDLMHDAPELDVLRQRVIATHHLDPLDESEVEAYVIHRLSCAGWQANPGFATEIFADIYAHTAGIPEDVNILMHRLMVMGALERLTHFNNACLSAVIADMSEEPFAYDAVLSESVAPFRDDPLSEVRPEDYEIIEDDPDAFPLDAIKLPSLVRRSFRPDAGHEPEYQDILDAEEPLLLCEPAPEFVMEPLVERVTPHIAAIVHTPAAGEYAALNARLNELEKRAADQDDALRRVLATMIDLMKNESFAGAGVVRESRAA